MVKTALILLGLILAGFCLAQNYALRWHSPDNIEQVPTNCIAEWQDLGAQTVLPEGFDFLTNQTGLRFYLQFSETNVVAWQSNRVALTTSNLTYWVARRDMHLSNVLWYSTNATPLNLTLALSNVFQLRAIEERLAYPNGR